MNFKILETFQKIQQDVMLSDIFDLEFSKIIYCEGDKTAFWNYALIKNQINKKQLLEVEERMESLQRKPAFYLENKKENQEIVKFLKSEGYKLSFEDSWMFFDDKEEHFFNNSVEIKKVESKKDLNEFLETFNKSYQDDDPQNPYGSQRDYAEVTKKAWLEHNKKGRPETLECFVAYQGNNPVAVATLSNKDRLGYIFNVGSTRDTRGKGFGKAVSLFCVNRSKEKGNKAHFLATEEGGYPNEFYKRIGFRTHFTASGFVKRLILSYYL